MDNRDKALWISFYDLPLEGREAYLAWLHNDHLPRLLQRSGVLWAAHYGSEKKNSPSPFIHHTDDRFVPSGGEYIVLIGGENTHVFAKDAQSFVRGTPSPFFDELSDEDKRMLAMRVGERVTIMIEEARIDGPEQREGAMDLSPCIQLGTFNASSCEVEDELLSWYAGWRMPALRKLPGCVGLRKLVSAVGWAKHGVIYEFVSLAARNDCFPTLARLYPQTQAWSNEFVSKLIHAPGSAHVACRIWPPAKYEETKKEVTPIANT